MKDELRALICAGDTRQILRELPVEVRQKFGRALMMVQTGDTPKNTKFLQGFRVPVQEIRISHDSEAYRAVYTVAIHDKVYLLHVFHKKSKRGVGIPPRDLELIGRRLRDALTMEAG